MKVRPADLAQFIQTNLHKRITSNLKIGCLDPISLKFTRTELRGFTNTVRIENNTIARMIEELNEQGYVVQGTKTSENFEITVDAKSMLTAFDTLGDLVSVNEWTSETIDCIEES